MSTPTTADTPTVRSSYPVAGMTCAACVHHVGEALRAVPGVTGASVNLATASAAVEHRPGAVDPAALAQAVAAAGYRLDTAATNSANAAAAAAGRDDARRREERALRTRLLLAAAAAVILLLGSFPALPWTDALLTLWWYPLLLWAVATPVQLWAGWPFYTAGWAGLRRGQPNMHTLIALGTTVAYGYSAAAVIAGLLDIAAWRSGGLHFDMAAVIIALILLGRWLEARALSRTSDAIVRLMDLQPRTAHLIAADGATSDLPTYDVPVEQVAVGDTVLVRPGEQVPVDGVVQSGASAVDESSLTGESMPVDKAAGAAVYTGTLNGAGAFTMRATRVGDDTALAQVIRLVDEAQGSAAPVQRLADRVAAWFVPAVGIVALTAAAVWLLLGPAPSAQYAMLTLVAVFIIACPCALGLATPTAIIVGVGRGAERGILMRNAAALERAHAVNLVAVDKTGTLTHGQPQVVAVVAAAKSGSDANADADILRCAMAVEQFSEHPIARAVMRYGQAQGLAPAPSDAAPSNLTAVDFMAHQGAGVTGIVDGRPVVVGNAALLSQYGIEIDGIETSSIETNGVETSGAMSAAADGMAAQGQTPLFVAEEGRLRGVIAVSDTVRPNAPGAVDALRDQGVRVVMLTGDRPEVAASVAAACGIDEYRAGLRPGDKAAALRELRAAGNVAAMVGDGVNDAPALAVADVGIAMGGGADAARETADIALMRDDLLAVSTALRLSRATMRTVRQNLFWAFFYNSLLIPVAAGALYPVFAALGGVPPGLGFFFGDAGFLNPILAALAMAFSSVSVVGNSLRLRKAPI